ncbi:MAG: leucine-rich repeat protein [Clostridiales bacterium]|jgi:hypothetical protein|nr:leucine-rich repeat protein [Clostridiales bacterium]
MAKRFCLFALSLAFLLASFPTPAIADESDFVIEDGVLTEYRGNGGIVAIPEGVKRIAQFVFFKNDSITGFVFPESLERADNDCLTQLSGVTEATIPANWTSFGSGVFYSCPNLKKITFLGNEANCDNYFIFTNNHPDMTVYGKPGTGVEQMAIEKRLFFLPIGYEPDREGADEYSQEYVDNLNAQNLVMISTTFNQNEGGYFPFTDRAGNFAFALADGISNDLQIKDFRGNTVAQISSLHPNIGLVAQDSDGNYYVAWSNNASDNTSDKASVFISKHSSDGALIKETGFTGGTDDPSACTKAAFNGSTCDFAIHDGVFMVSYARTMYNGHQSNHVIAVNMGDMSPVEMKSVPYSSHSFDQRVIWSDTYSRFVFADRGDAYPRAFAVSTLSTQYRPFTFFLRANANYDMFVVNRTMSQLGGIEDVRTGIALVGSSAKSLSIEAETEPYNLFLQIFRIDTAKLDESSFVTKGVRSGATSDDINDNSGKPLVPVTDYGVQWLTNHSNISAENPRVAKTNDNRLVILWEEHSWDGKTSDSFIDSYYTIVSATGQVLKNKTSLGGIRVVGKEAIYASGAVWWISGNSIHSLQIESTARNSQDTIRADETAPASWASDSIVSAHDLGLVTQEMRRKYQSATTRAEFCRLAARFIEVYYNKPISDVLSERGVAPKTFADTEDRYIGAAAALGITSGTDAAKNLFSPNQALTREQAATMLRNVMNVTGENTMPPPGVLWTDAKEISDWAQAAADVMYSAKVMGGTSSTALVFSPKTAYTHEQAIVTVMNLWGSLH